MQTGVRALSGGQISSGLVGINSEIAVVGTSAYIAVVGEWGREVKLPDGRQSSHDCSLSSSGRDAHGPSFCYTLRLFNQASSWYTARLLQDYFKCFSTQVFVFKIILPGSLYVVFYHILLL